MQGQEVGISLGFQRSPLRAGRAGSKKRSSGSPRVAPLGTSRLDLLPTEKDRKITPCSGSLESLRQSGEKDQRQTSPGGPLLVVTGRRLLGLCLALWRLFGEGGR